MRYSPGIIRKCYDYVKMYNLYCNCFNEVYT